jgi:hypothetical protein
VNELRALLVPLFIFLAAVDATAQPGSQRLTLGSIQLAKPDDLETLFYLAGKRMYEVGAMNGGFPFIGWHIPGEMGGVWAHPMKVLNGFSFVVEGSNGRWVLTDAKSFSHEFAQATFRFSRGPLEVMRRDFVVEDEPALFVLVTLANQGEEPLRGTLRFAADINLRPSWFSFFHDGRDMVVHEQGCIIAHDAAVDWTVVLGANVPPKHHQIEGTTGILEYPFALGAGEEREVRFLIVAEHETSADKLLDQFHSLMERCEKVSAEKIALYNEKVFEGMGFSCSDPMFEQGYYCARANLAMLYADVSPYVGWYLFAGVPEYVQLFGCDTAYSIPGVVGTGFWDEALESLLALCRFGEIQGGRIPHEVSTGGKVYHQGNVQETPQFVSAVWSYFSWTGDRDFLERAYPLTQRGIEFVLGRTPHHSYPVGSGMVERPGAGPMKVDSACYVYQALLDLSQMADALDKPHEASFYKDLADELRCRFNEDWWMEEEGLFADSLRRDHAPILDGHWVVAVPLEVGIADEEKALRALERIKKEWVSEWGLVHTRDVDERVWTLPTGVLALAAFRYGDARTGAWLLGRIASTIERGMLGAFSELIPNGGELLQLWSAAMFLRGITEGVFGLSPLAYRHRLALRPQLPPGWKFARLSQIRIGPHVVNSTLTREECEERITIEHRGGPAGLEIEVTIPETELEIAPEQIGYAEKRVGGFLRLVFVLDPGQSVQIITRQGRTPR